MTQERFTPGKRYNCCCTTPEQHCRKREAKEIAKEIQAIWEDPNIEVYTNPDQQLIATLITRALAYTGEWYWARVVFHQPKPVTRIEISLHKLGRDHGVYICYQQPINIQIL